MKQKNRPLHVLIAAVREIPNPQQDIGWEVVSHGGVGHHLKEFSLLGDRLLPKGFHQLCFQKAVLLGLRGRTEDDVPHLGNDP